MQFPSASRTQDQPAAPLGAHSDEYELKEPIPAMAAAGKVPATVVSIDRGDPVHVWINSHMGKHRVNSTALQFDQASRDRLIEEQAKAAKTAEPQLSRTETPKLSLRPNLGRRRTDRNRLTS